MTSETTSNWYDKVAENLAARHVKHTNYGPQINPNSFRQHMVVLQFKSTGKWVEMLSRAARQRNVNRSAYSRRAVSILVAHDLGIPLQEVLQETPMLGTYGVVQNKPAARDDGKGIENWCPHPGCDGEHLRLP